MSSQEGRHTRCYVYPHALENTWMSSQCEIYSPTVTIYGDADLMRVNENTTKAVIRTDQCLFVMDLPHVYLCCMLPPTATNMTKTRALFTMYSNIISVMIVNTAIQCKPTPHSRALFTMYSNIINVMIINTAIQCKPTPQSRALFTMYSNIISLMIVNTAIQCKPTPHSRALFTMYSNIISVMIINTALQCKPTP
ncbi:hypothetical protein J6590_009179 [Homalodisca vitripennis]|nr:hypothetical protein J6590_009179 [Homalodisca vitripennis]